MKTLNKLLIGLFFVSVLLCNGCKKDASDTSNEPADKFVGAYTYVLTAPAFGTQSGNLTVKKTSTNKISMIQEGGSPTFYTVDGNNLTEDAGQIAVGIPVSETQTADFTENSMGTLDGKVITINGTWTNPSYTTLTFKVVATRK